MVSNPDEHPPTVDCPKCDGTGIVDDGVDPYFGIALDRDCGWCGGTGQVINP